MMLATLGLLLALFTRFVCSAFRFAISDWILEYLCHNIRDFVCWCLEVLLRYIVCAGRGVKLGGGSIYNLLSLRTSGVLAVRGDRWPGYLRCLVAVSNDTPRILPPSCHYFEHLIVIVIRLATHFCRVIICTIDLADPNRQLFDPSSSHFTRLSSPALLFTASTISSGSCWATFFGYQFLVKQKTIEYLQRLLR